jgi:23S rRNA (adenine2503-C2)-methyltransferase
VIGQRLDVEADGFLSGKGVQVAADRVHLAGYVLGGAGARALEEHVFHEMGDAIGLGGLAAGAGFDPHAHGYGAQVVHALGQDYQAVRQYGAAKVSLVCHRHWFRFDCRASGRVGHPASCLLVIREWDGLRLFDLAQASGLDGPVAGRGLKCSMLDPAVSTDPSQLVQLDAGNSTLGSRADSEARRRPLFGLDGNALAALMTELGEPAWRAAQLVEAMYRQRVVDLNEITTLSKNLRLKLAKEGWGVRRPQIAQVFKSVDGTERYLVQCLNGEATDAQTVETVWMPEGDDGEAGDGTDSANPQAPGAPHLDEIGKDWNRATICVSSQVGCAVNCQFCLTAKLGLQRNLTAGEIAGQVVSVLAKHGVEVGRQRVNLVFMGMGEPFLNYDSFMGAVRLLVREVGLSPQRMTVSTSGIVPGIERFAQEHVEIRPKLAISLNAPNDLIRQELMPINRKWNIETVMDAVRRVKLRPRERITFEYVLLGGVTDQPVHAKEVARLVRRTGLPVKVNLIAWNPGPGIAYSMPASGAVEAFRNTLAGEGIPTYLRRPRGRDIYAACGQLKRTVEG